MKILHTSDWHLGCSFGPKKRYEELDETLTWLLELIREKQIEAVIIAGDVFDSFTPSNQAAQQYYHFLLEAGRAGVQNIIVVAGNHDSPGFLEAPRCILAGLNVHVIVRAADDPAEQIIPLKNADGTVCAVVCAIPFLHDSDVRRMESGEDAVQQNKRLHDGIIAHYNAVCGKAKELYPGIPMIATGHFFAVNSKTGGGSFITSSVDIGIGELPDCIDYLALGHIHTPQILGGRENARYSGSLLRMSFGDADVGKEVLVLDSDHLRETPERISVPEYQLIRKISGTKDELTAELESAKHTEKSCWFHAVNTGPFEPRLQTCLNDVCGDSSICVITCSNKQPNPELIRRTSDTVKSLKELSPEQVFRIFLKRQGLDPDAKKELLNAFHIAEEKAKLNGREDEE